MVRKINAKDLFEVIQWCHPFECTFVQGGRDWCNISFCYHILTFLQHSQSLGPVHFTWSSAWGSPGIKEERKEKSLAYFSPKHLIPSWEKRMLFLFIYEFGVQGHITKNMSVIILTSSLLSKYIFHRSSIMTGSTRFRIKYSKEREKEWTFFPFSNF